MNNLRRLALVASVGVFAQVAQAQATFTLETAYYTLDSSGPFAFNYFPDSTNMKVDFTGTAPAFKVGGSTQFGSGVGTIIYTVTTQTPIMGLDMLIQGDVELWGKVNWTETVEAGTDILGIMNGTDRGSAYSGGVDGAFTEVKHLDFSRAVTSFKVKKTFDLDIAANRPPSDSLATVNLIEQNLDPVPEPVSIIGLAMGALALVARRRKK